MQPERIGRYRVVRRLGQGGMGVVYEAHDDRLDRTVAIKVIRPELFSNPQAQDRFRREARAAARVNHPNICALYEFDDDQGQLFLAMELLAGEPLSTRLASGPLVGDELFRTSAQILDALSALHQNGIIHRDLKPANIFLTPHGAKLMDFGLALPSVADGATHLALTGAGSVVGTPQYMSPERLFGESADERSDVWAAATVIYELASGVPAFSGASFAAVVHAIGYDEPAPLADPRLASLDRALRAGFVKDPAKRIGSASELAARLRDAEAVVSGRAPASGSDPRAVASPTPAAPVQTRFVALPLRILRPDAETDFLAFSVPDAVSASLSSLESLIVRAPRALPGGEFDAQRIGRDWSVDVILAGTLMRAGATVRVSAQLIDAADGTLRWSETAQAPLTDLFQLQDALTTRIVSSLHLPLSGRDRRALERQAPANPEAYALYMRANELMRESSGWEEGCELYERAVALDPGFAPAWAGLGRARRLLAKWVGGAESDLLPKAQVALARALELDPDLSLAHDTAASVDVELGLAPSAMERLLLRAAIRPRDPGLMTGLVTACRYSGLLDQSLAAYEKAMAIDPDARTSGCWTYFHLGDYAAAMRSDIGVPPFCSIASRLLTGDIASDDVRAIEDTLSGRFQFALRIYRQISEGHVAQAMADFQILDQSGLQDPEAWFVIATFLARAHAFDESLSVLVRAIDAGFICHRQLIEREFWSPMRGERRFQRLLDRARLLVDRSRLVYERAGGVAILG